MLYCSENNKVQSGETCFDRNTLQQLCEAHNKTTAGIENPISASLIENGDLRTLWNTLQQRYRAQCGDEETCWIDNETLMSRVGASTSTRIKYELFKPRRPKQSAQWLTNYDIDIVMHQNTVNFKDFLWCGAFPCDYFTNHPEEFPIDLLNKKSCAFILNTDPEHRRGEHWIAIYIVITPSDLLVTYFDSEGQHIKPQFYPFMDGLATLRPVLFVENNCIYQKGGSECGVFCIENILARLRNDIVEDSCRANITDRAMTKLRDLYFRPHKAKKNR